MSNISQVPPFSGDIQLVVDGHFINQLKAHGLYDQILAKQPTDNPDIHIMGLFSLSSILQVNLIETNDFDDILNDLQNRTQPLDLVREQQNYDVIREVISWKNRGNPDESLNLPAQQSLPAQALPTDRQPSRYLRQKLNLINYCETRLKRQGTPQTIRFQPALSSQNGFTRAEAEKRHAFFESLERSRTQRRQVPTGDPCLYTSVSSPKLFSHTLQEQTPPEY